MRPLRQRTTLDREALARPPHHEPAIGPDIDPWRDAASRTPQPSPMLEEEMKAARSGAMQLGSWQRSTVFLKPTQSLHINVNDIEAIGLASGHADKWPAGMVEAPCVALPRHHHRAFRLVAGEAEKVGEVEHQRRPR